jgi:MFS family permease
LIANLGFWVQQIALGWLVYDMTRSVSLLGTIGFCGNLPFLVFGLVGGAIVDRTSRRTVMLATLAVLATAATVLALLTGTGRIEIWHVVAISMIGGTATALLVPAMQAVIPSLVREAELPNAVSLNAVQFNLARTVGPALAGVLHGPIGAAGCFALNASSLLVFALVVGRLGLPPQPAMVASPMGRALREGIGYARGHAVIGPALFLAAAMSLFGFPYLVLLPALAGGTLGLEATGLGFLTAAVGTGAVSGGLALSAASALARRDSLATLGAIAFGATLVAFPMMPGVRGAVIVLFFLGFLQTVSIASINTVIQLNVHEGMRGRIMSMMTVILFGFATTGALVIGILGDWIGVPAALAAGGVVIVMAATGVLLRTPARGSIAVEEA